MTDPVKDDGCQTPIHDQKTKTLEERTAIIREKLRFTVGTSIEIGDELNAVKQDKKKDRDFLEWLKEIGGLEPKTAQNYMKVAKTFVGLKTREIVSHLPLTILRFLSRKEAAVVRLRKELLAELASDDKPSLKDIKSRVSEVEKIVVTKKPTKETVEASQGLTNNDEDSESFEGDTTNDDFADVDEAANWIAKQFDIDKEKALTYFENSDPTRLIKRVIDKIYERIDDDNIKAKGSKKNKPQTSFNEIIDMGNSPPRDT